jgi:two-component system response regulator FlrC
MPTLRERRDDIPALAAHFVRYAAARNGVSPVDFTAAALERLARAPWRGNVRELQNVIERTVLLSGGVTVDDGDLRMSPGTGAGPDFSEVERVFRTGSVRDMERLMILNRLAENDDNRTRSAESLEISVRTLRNKLNEYGVKRSTTEIEDEVYSI